MRTIRLNKSALGILRDIHPGALDSYLSAFPDNRFTGDPYHILRNHRMAEAIAMSTAAGIETAPYVLPRLQKEAIRLVIPETPSYYVARHFKKIFAAELNKTIFTRVVGLWFCSGGCYAVYNTRDAVMKWSGLGELKARQDLSEIVRMNAGMEEVTSALLFGNSADVALQTLLESDKSRKRDIRFDKIYHSIHFIPMNQDGMDLLRILTLPDWREKLLGVLFKPEMRPKGYCPFPRKKESQGGSVLRGFYFVVKGCWQVCHTLIFCAIPPLVYFAR